MYLLYLAVGIFSIFLLHRKFTWRSRICIYIIWIILFVLIGTFAYFTDDYIQYSELVERVHLTPFASFHIEPIWRWLAEFSDCNIHYFRFIAFGSLVLIVSLIIKYSRVSVVCFICYYSLWGVADHFCWIRQPVGMGIFMLGLLFFLQKHYWRGLLFILVSFFLHKAIIMQIILLPFIFIPVNKKSISIFFALMPLFYSFFFFLLKDDAFDFMMGVNYLVADGEFDNRHIIFSIISLCGTVIHFYLIVKTIELSRKTSDPMVNGLGRYLWGILYAAFFVFFLPLETNVIYKRILSFAVFPMIIVWSKCIGHKVLVYNNIWLLISLIVSFILNVCYLIGNNYTRIDKLLMF